MMKRIVCILLSLMLMSAAVFALAEEPAEAPAGESAETAAEAPAEEPAEAPAEEPAEAAAEEPAEAVAEEPAETAAEPQEPVLLATINGEEIWSDNVDLKYAYDYYVDMAVSYGLDPAEESVAPLIRQYSMEYAIQATVIRQKAAEFGLAPTEEDVEQVKTEIRAKWEAIVQSYVDESGVITDESGDDDRAAARADALATIKDAYGYDEERYMNENLGPAIYALLEGRVEASVVGDQTVTDEEIEQYFQDLVKEDRETYENDVPTYEFYTQYYGQDSYYTPEGYRAITHILLEVDDELMDAWRDLIMRMEEQQSAEQAESTEEEAPAETAEGETEAAEGEAEAEEPEAEVDLTTASEPVTQEMIDAAEKAILDSVQATVDEINAKLESGVSFDDLIREYGKDPGMEDDAYRAAGYPIHKESILYDPYFVAAAMELKEVGETSKPIVGQAGVHILHYLRDIPGGAVEMTDAMKEEFRATLQSELAGEIFSAALEKWVESSVIEYTADGESWKPDLQPEEEESPAGTSPAGDDDEATGPDAAEVVVGSSPADEAPAGEEGPASPAEEAGEIDEGPSSPAEEAAAQ